MLWAQAPRHFAPHPCLGALHFANLVARLQKSWVLPALVPAPQSGTPTPSRPESERSELAAYLLCMDANGSCLQCISIGALQTAGRPTPPPPDAKGLPSAAQKPRRQAGHSASWTQKTLLKPRGFSQSRPAGDRRALRLEAGNRATAVRLDEGRPTPGGFLPGLAQAAAPDTTRGSCCQGACSLGGIA